MLNVKVRFGMSLSSFFKEKTSMTVHSKGSAFVPRNFVFITPCCQ